MPERESHGYDALPTQGTVHEQNTIQGEFHIINAQKELVIGENEAKDLKAIEFDSSKITLLAEEELGKGPISGVEYVAHYTDSDSSGAEVAKPVVAFLYHKTDSDGNLETSRRVIILDGIGLGEHPGHAGQEPTEYLVGSQIGTVAVDSIEPNYDADAKIEPKSFSVACIVGGPYGEPVLANPS